MPYLIIANKKSYVKIDDLWVDYNVEEMTQQIKDMGGRKNIARTLLTSISKSKGDGRSHLGLYEVIIFVEYFWIEKYVRRKMIMM